MLATRWCHAIAMAVLLVAPFEGRAQPTSVVGKTWKDAHDALQSFGPTYHSVLLSGAVIKYADYQKPEEHRVVDQVVVDGVAKPICAIAPIMPKLAGTTVYRETDPLIKHVKDFYDKDPKFTYLERYYDYFILYPRYYINKADARDKPFRAQNPPAGDPVLPSGALALLEIAVDISGPPEGYGPLALTWAAVASSLAAIVAGIGAWFAFRARSSKTKSKTPGGP